MKVKVAINGYGTIGKRVADAVSKQPDMEVVGVVKTKPTFEAYHAVEKGYRLYAVDEGSLKAFKEAGLPTEGTLGDLLELCDIVVDATPGGVGAKYKPLYEEKKLKAIFQGGEKKHVAEVSFVAQCNYKEALGKNYIRVVSCNTTGLCRALGTLDKAFGVKRARVVLVRRAADPWDIKTGPINAIKLDPVTLPSHHGPDVQTVIPHLNISTVAVVVPTTLMHVHVVNVELKEKASAEQIAEAFEKAPRIKLLSAERGFKSTAQIIEYARDLGRPRYDLPELIIWRESISCVDGEVFFTQAVHQEAIVVPENVDAIRASTSLMDDPEKSIALTNRVLGIE